MIEQKKKNKKNEITVNKIDIDRYLPRCMMSGDDDDNEYPGICRNRAIYNITIFFPSTPRRYAVIKSCQEHLEDAKKLGIEAVEEEEME